MIAYFISSDDLLVKDVLTFDKYQFKNDIDFADKSTIEVIRKPNVENDDFVLCKNGNEITFVGICGDISCDENEIYTVTLKQKENLFDRSIFVGDEALISSTGIEDFIASEIEENWVNSDDPQMDRDYFEISCLTHTKISAKANVFGGVESGIYNLKTFIGNAKEHYRVFVDFVITSTVQINIRVDSAPVAPIDVTISEVANYDEVYSVDVLSKLMVRWKNTQTESEDDVTYYLKTDRSITTEKTDQNRAKGIAKAIYIEAESYAEMYEKVVDTFSSNSYQHKISFSLKKSSKAYPASDYYVGRIAKIKTVTGVQQSIVTASSGSDESGFVDLVFGKLKVTLTEKLRGK